MLRKTILVQVLVFSSLLLGAQTGHSGQQMLNDYAQKEVALKGQIERLKRIYDEQVKQGRPENEEEQDRWDFYLNDLQSQIKALEDQMRGLNAAKVQEDRRLREIDRVMKQKMRAEQKKMVQQKRNSARQNQQNRQAQQDRQRAERARAQERTREKARQAALRKQKEERARKEQYNANYNREMSRMADEYAEKSRNAEWHSSDAAVGAMVEALNRSRIRDRHDGGGLQPEKTAHITSGRARRSLKNLLEDGQARYVAYTDDEEAVEENVGWIDKLCEKTRGVISSEAAVKLTQWTRKVISKGSVIGAPILKMYDLIKDIAAYKNWEKRINKEILDATEEAIRTGDYAKLDARLTAIGKEVEDYVNAYLAGHGVIPKNIPLAAEDAKREAKDVTYKVVDAWLGTKKD